MNCINCYQEIPDGTKFCPYCGAKQPAVNQQKSTAEQSVEDQQRSTVEQENQYSCQQSPCQPVNGTPYLVLAIVFTAVSVICCCPLSTPFGIVAIVYAAKIRSAVRTGDWEAAQHAAKMAKIWIIVAGVLFVLGLIFSMLLGAVNTEYHIERYYDWD